LSFLDYYWRAGKIWPEWIARRLDRRRSLQPGASGNRNEGGHIIAGVLAVVAVAAGLGVWMTNFIQGPLATSMNVSRQASAEAQQLRCSDCGHDFLIAFVQGSRRLSRLQHAPHGRVGGWASRDVRGLYTAALVAF